jgi:serine protease Do
MQKERPLLNSNVFPLPPRSGTVARRPGRVAAAALVMGLALATGPAPAIFAQTTPESFADLSEKVSPSVVMITTTSTVASQAGFEDGGPQLPEDSPFNKFFQDFLDKNGQPPMDAPQRSEALGSGFVISADGYIVTNNHVIEGADEIEIDFFNKQHYIAKLIGTDKKTDIALLKIDAPEPLPFVVFGNSDNGRVGDWVLAMGNPLGEGFSVSAGIISARNRELSGTYDDFLQTDAAINKGNSGGPLFNMSGEVIGVNTAILSPTGGSIGIGFSMASNVVSKVVIQLKEFGETRRGWLGVRIQDVTPDVAEAMGLETANGALVTDVPEGPSKDAGIQPGDVIVTFNGMAVTDSKTLVHAVADAPIGDAVPVVVMRSGKEETISVVLGRRETAEAEEPVPAAATSPDKPETADILGMTLLAVTPEMETDLGLQPGTSGLVITRIDESSAAFDKGLRNGDVITEAGQTKIESLEDLTKQIAETKDAGRKSMLLLVRTQGEPRFVALSLED